MVVPFEKLGKETKDLFEEHYNIGQVKIDVKNKLSSLLGFDFSGICNAEDGKVTSTLESKLDFSNYGFLSNVKWNTDNDVMTEVIVSDNNLLDGFKLSFNTKCALVSSKKSGSIKALFEGGNYNLAGDLDFESGSPRLNTSGVYKHNNFLVGTQALIDLKASTMQKQTLVLGFIQSDLSMLANIENFKEGSLGIYKRVSSSVERGVQVNWDDKNVAKLALGCQHIIDGSSAIKAKMNNDGQIGLAYIYQYRTGVKCSISALLEAKNLLSGGHKLGLGLTFEG